MMYLLTLDERMMQVIVDSLSNAPYRIAAPVLAELQKQVNQQNTEQASKGNGQEAHPQ